MYRKILVPYDGSKPSEHALEQAMGLAKLIKNQVRIIFLYIVQEVPVPVMIERPIRSPKTGEVITVSKLIKEINEEVKTNMAKMLDEKKQKYTSDSGNGILIETKSLVGNPADKIIEFANEEKVDLIVIGNVGLSGLSKVKALGSVSRSASERASCPVLIIKS